MGDIGHIKSMARSSDWRCILQPPKGRCEEDLSSFPPRSEWRCQSTSTSRLRVVTNHFPVDVSKLVDTIYQYHLKIYRRQSDGSFDMSSDIAPVEDYRVTNSIVSILRDNHPDWKSIGWTYDSRSTVFTSAPLPLPEANPDEEDGTVPVPELVEEVKVVGVTSSRNYMVKLTAATVLSKHDVTRPESSEACLRALDLVALSFARSGQYADPPEWFVVQSNAYRAQASQFVDGTPYYIKRGYHSSLKACMAGLMLVSDMAVSCFLSGGPALGVISLAAECRRPEDFIRQCSQRGLQRRQIENIENVMKGAKILVTHLRHNRKFKGLGPPANSPESKFEFEGNYVTVAEYFDIMSEQSSAYSRLKHPYLPTINVTSRKRPVWVPLELVDVAQGQSVRLKAYTEKMTAEVIRTAAARPRDRFQHIISGDDEGVGLISVLQRDPVANQFGFTGVSSEPLSVPATILPNAVLQYRDTVVEPELKGQWFSPKTGFVSPARPTDGRSDKIMYGILAIINTAMENKRICEDFERQLQMSMDEMGMPLKPGGPILTSNDVEDNILNNLLDMRKHGGAIAIVLLGDKRLYGLVKQLADTIPLVTQCVLWDTVKRKPKGIMDNLVLKINTKLGGVNHILRRPGGERSVPEHPPGWVFDELCMLVGIDVSHAEPGSKSESIAAVVGSINRETTQYAASISAQASREEEVTQLEDLMVELFEAFKKQNGNQMPKRVIVYRDGVSHGQFQRVRFLEVPAIQQAMECMGCLDTKLTFVICSKGHSSRFAFDEGNNSYINCCPGVCVGDESGITMNSLNEFYIQSHVAIQGTAKMARYSVIYDDIGISNEQLAIFTYWNCYLYSRCNKSMSKATPAAYAHLAATRARKLYTSGVSSQELREISKTWSQRGGVPSSMFFL